MVRAGHALVVKFDRLKIYRVRLPLKQPWNAGGLQLNSVETLILEAADSEHVVWVESTPFAAPLFTPDWAAASFQLCRDWLGPKVLGQSFGSSSDLAVELDRFQGNGYAKALFDQAYWALESAKLKRSVANLLGSGRASIEVSETLGVFASIDLLLAAVENAVNQGFQTLKLKFCHGWELEPLQAVRRNFPRLQLLIDCNGSYSRDDLALFRSLDAIGLQMIEQPLGADDLVGHAQLAQAINTPLCLDESASSLTRVANALELRSCQAIHIKLSRVGGLTNAKKIHDLCQSHGVSCTIGSNLESAIGSEQVVALASLPGFTSGTIFPTARQYEMDLADEPLVLKRNENGVPIFEVIATPGGQRRPNADRLKSWTIESAQLKN